MSRNQFEPPLLRERRDQKHELHPGERLTDALTRPAAKGEVRKTRQSRLELRRPSVRFEAFGFHVIPRIAMHYPLAHDDDGARRDIVRPDAVLVDGATADEPRRRIETHRFGDDPRGVGESINVGNTG